jgi:hypothetical protein
MIHSPKANITCIHGVSAVKNAKSPVVRAEMEA